MSEKEFDLCDDDDDAKSMRFLFSLKPKGHAYMSYLIRSMQ